MTGGIVVLELGAGSHRLQRWQNKGVENGFPVRHTGQTVFNMV